MSKPEDIPADVWNAAFDAMPPINRAAYDESPFAMVLRLAFARAIMAAKAEEREACARLSEEIGIPRVTSGDRVLMVPVDIAAAIRKRGEP